jgi:hypothetical protein
MNVFRVNLNEVAKAFFNFMRVENAIGDACVKGQFKFTDPHQGELLLVELFDLLYEMRDL